ncbi:Uncharacterised protein [Enterobacter hormaechei]|nr:Uncharacterised protein [Enterobacter hormaechei]
MALHFLLAVDGFLAAYAITGEGYVFIRDQILLGIRRALVSRGVCGFPFNAGCFATHHAEALVLAQRGLNLRATNRKINDDVAPRECT